MHIAAGAAARAERLNALRVQVVEVALRHLRAARVAGTQNEDALSVIGFNHLLLPFPASVCLDIMQHQTKPALTTG